MTKAVWWNVFYKVGTQYEWLLVYAHDKVQAETLAKIQIQSTKGAKKIEILKTRKKRDKTLDNSKKP